MISIPSVGILQVVVLSIATFMFGWLWYSFIVMKPWMEAMKLSDADKAAGMEGMGPKMFGMFILNTLSVYVIGLFTLGMGAAGFVDGAVVGILLWAGFSITAVADHVVWGNKSPALFWINGLYGLIFFIVTAGVFAIW